MNTWFANKEIEVVNINKKWYALNGWNGEVYTDCWECENPFYGSSCEVIKDNIEIKPIYNNENNIIGYEIF